MKTPGWSGMQKLDGCRCGLESLISRLGVLIIAFQMGEGVGCENPRVVRNAKIRWVQVWPGKFDFQIGCANYCISDG